jgi:hypothetical protein
VTVCVYVCVCVCVCVCLCVCVALQTFEFHTFQQARLAVGLRECRGLLHKWKRRRDSARHEHEGREIRTPNLLIWSQTRCRCAMPPVYMCEHRWYKMQNSHAVALQVADRRAPHHLFSADAGSFRGTSGYSAARQGNGAHLHSRDIRVL